MLKKLRIKFIVSAMVATTLVLSAIIGIINIKNYSDITNSAIAKIELIAENNGKFPQNKPDDGIDDPSKDPAKEPPKEDPNGDRNGGNTDDGNTPTNKPASPGDRIHSPEAPFETRYFTVILSSSGTEIELTDTENIAAIDDETAKSHAENLIDKAKTEGKISVYRYKLVNFSDGRKAYVFLDCSRDLSTFKDFLQASVLISVAGLIVVFVLIIILSGAVMKPIAESYKKQKRFITDASHELKTPLTVIGASCDVLEFDSGENEWTKTIKEQVKELTSLTNKLVFLSKIDEEDKKLGFSEFSLSEVCEENLKGYFVVAKAENKELTAEIAPDLSLNGDMGMIKEMISALMDNAVKYSDKNGKICFSLKKSGKYKKITVENTTDNLPDGNLDLLFERFYRPDSSRNSATGGHGIGLSVVKAIAELHKGTVTATKKAGNVISFCVTL